MRWDVRWRWAVMVATACGLSACSRGPDVSVSAESDVFVSGGETTRSFPLTKSETDTRPTFRLDSAKAFHLEFGRGSGWHGLATVKLDPSGLVVITRRVTGEPYRYETGQLTLSKAAVASVVDAVNKLDLTRLKSAYHADVADGTQWVFWLQQDRKEKSIYFDNHFPVPIRQFADRLEQILTDAGAEHITYERTEGDEYQRALWDSIKRR